MAHQTGAPDCSGRDDKSEDHIASPLNIALCRHEENTVMVWPGSRPGAIPLSRIASGRSAFGRTPKNFHSLRVLRRSITATPFVDYGSCIAVGAPNADSEPRPRQSWSGLYNENKIFVTMRITDQSGPGRRDTTPNVSSW